MYEPVRRFVTGHDKSGKAVVVIEDADANLQEMSRFGIVRRVLWASNEMPADLSRGKDPTTGVAHFRDGIGPLPNGSVLVVIDFLPNVELNPDHIMHRTKTLDYALVLSGEIDMRLSDSVIHCKAGDVIVQQGTIHGWVNKGKISCRMAFIMVDAIEPAAWKLSEA
jgi:quercetin dioxygenase-like cupin family protein